MSFIPALSNKMNVSFYFSDDRGRYTFSRQAEMCRWNLGKFAEALSMCLPEEQSKAELELFDETFEEHYITKMRKKLGLLLNNLPEDRYSHTFRYSKTRNSHGFCKWGGCSYLQDLTGI